jgi:diaminohydroxyphosphoribosylaminopyrimidine deaminase/5-amino-6-(5-phosphoribosylamino)uracil reductase
MPKIWSPADEVFMDRALSLASQGEGFTNPNPMVGAVLVNDDQIVGEGFTQPYGGHHAEWQAIQQAGEHTKNATLYVNWEPCVAYPNKQTHPCVNRIIDAGIQRVVIASFDPHPEVFQKGVAQLTNAGIKVEVGLLDAESQRLNEVSIVYHQKNRPFVCLKWAMTLDGHIATATGDSKWITNEVSRTFAHRLRHRYAAILVGINTVLKDDPSLTVRHVEGYDPWRIVLDSAGKISPFAKVIQQKSTAPSVIATTNAMSENVEKSLIEAGALVWRLPDVDEKVNLNALLTRMKQQKLDSVLVEGGGEIHWSFLSQHLYDKVACFIAPKIIGGQDALSPIGGAGVSLMKDALQLRDLTIDPLDGDWLLTGYPE